MAKGYVGLGSGAFACLFESIRTPTSSDLDFLPMGAFLFLACASIPSWCFMEKQQHPVPDVLTPLHFRVLFVSLLCLAAVVVGSALMNLYKQEHGGKQATSSGEPEPNYYMTFLILTVWIGPLVMQLFLPRKNVAAEEAIYSMLLEGGEEDQDRRDTNQIVSDDENEEDISSSSSRSSLRSIDAEGFGDEVNDTAGEFSEVQDKNLFQMLQSPSAWILLWISTMIVGVYYFSPCVLSFPFRKFPFRSKRIFHLESPVNSNLICCYYILENWFLKRHRWGNCGNKQSRSDGRIAQISISRHRRESFTLFRRSIWRPSANWRSFRKRPKLEHRMVLH